MGVFHRSSLPITAPPAPDAPRRQAEAVTEGESPAVPAQAGKPALRVLVVDDDSHVGGALRELLTDFDHEVVGLAGDSIQALVLIKTLRPDVVVTDLRMPGMSGLELAQLASRLPHAPAVVMVSAYDDPSLQREAREAGVREFLVKGTSGELVHRAVVAAAASNGASDGSP